MNTDKLLLHEALAPLGIEITNSDYMLDCMHMYSIILTYYDVIWIPVACAVMYLPSFSQIPNLPYYTPYWMVGLDRCLVIRYDI